MWQLAYESYMGDGGVAAQIDGYTSLLSTLGPLGASEAVQKFVSPGNQDATILLISAKGKDSMRFLRFVDWINEHLDAAILKSHGVSCSGGASRDRVHRDFGS
jgi:hypothetical protein